MPKIDPDLEDHEIKVEISDSATLKKLECKCVKVKFEDTDGKELVGVYFNIDKFGSEDGRHALFTIPDKIRSNLRQ